MSWIDMLFGVGLLGAVVLVGILDYRRSPFCNWCEMRHGGRCIYNPRSGRFFANTNDGHFDYDDPNK